MQINARFSNENSSHHRERIVQNVCASSRATNKKNISILLPTTIRINKLNRRSVVVLGKKKFSGSNEASSDCGREGQGGSRVFPSQVTRHVVLASERHGAERATEARRLAALEANVPVAVITARVTAPAPLAVILSRGAGALLARSVRFCAFCLSMIRQLLCKEKSQRKQHRVNLA